MADSSGQAIFTTPENNNFYARRKYKELNPHTHEIRLLRVHPARLTANELESVFPEWVKGDTDAADLVRSDSINERHEDFICCELLEPLPLESVTHKYAALSYCAGSASTTKRIMIDGFWFNAFANLEHALDGFMHCYDRFSTSRSSSLIRKENGLDRFVPVYDPDSTSGNLIWTDQACINQIGYSEKSHQVGFMRDIYQHAERTYVVLSTPDSPSQRVQRGVEAVQVTSQYLNDWIQELSDWRGYYEYWTKKCSNFFIQLVYEEPDHPICEALPQLVEFLHLVADAKWWTRAWVS
jgi:hypothetical protein